MAGISSNFSPPPDSSGEMPAAEATFFHRWELKIINYAKLINPKAPQSAARYLFRKTF
jgi:hypothetical protein